MIRAQGVKANGARTCAIADSVELEFDDRYRRRIMMRATGGLEFLLDLPEPTMLRGGDALILDDGRLVEVVAAREHLLDIRVGTLRDLARIAWHIGNRHLPAQIFEDRIFIRRDDIIADMARRLGGQVVKIEAPFDPEAGVPAVHSHGDTSGRQAGEA